MPLDRSIIKELKQALEADRINAEHVIRWQDSRIALWE